MIDHEHRWGSAIGWAVDALARPAGEARICETCRRLALVEPDGSFLLLDEGERADYLDAVGTRWKEGTDV